MFENLGSRLTQVLDRLKGRGALKQEDIDAAMREIRRALLEADVALPVVRDFIKKVSEESIGQNVVKSITPGQMVVKIVHDALVDLLGGNEDPLTRAINLQAEPPVVLLMLGLQGSGKTTTTAKLAHLLKTQDHKKVMMASLDVNRPAAQEQLRILGEQAKVETLPIIEGQQPVEITKRAMQSARLQGFDVLLLDTAGRLHISDDLMQELAQVKSVAQPAESLLIADSLTGQDAVQIAEQFSHKIGVTGVILTRMDGDGRGGAALSMRAVTKQPIKYVGVGEKIDALEPFHPDRIAGRILDMGDIVSLVEKASEAVEADEAEALAKRMMQGKFDLNDLLGQFTQMKKVGGIDGMMSLLPGINKAQKKMTQSGLDNKAIDRMEAVILSMTTRERAKPDIINAKRRIRIAKGSGTRVQDVNKILKMHQEMARVMKKVKKKGGLGALSSLFGGGAGTLPQMPPGGVPGMGDLGVGASGSMPPGWNKFNRR